MKISEFSNPQIVTLGVARLGGDAKTIDTEDVAIEVYQLAPHKFGWRKYPDRIDIAIVRYALTDATKDKFGWLTGNNQHGWLLSSKGVKWVASLPSELEGEDKPRRGSVLETLENEKFRLYQTSAFKKYQVKRTKEISLMDFQEFVRINAYFPERKRQERFTVIENAVSGDDKLNPLWRFLKKKFKQEMIPHET